MKSHLNLSVHPKQVGFSVPILIARFTVRKAMSDLNGNNRFVMSRNPTDMRPAGTACATGSSRLIRIPGTGDIRFYFLKAEGLTPVRFLNNVAKYSGFSKCSR